MAKTKVNINDMTLIEVQDRVEEIKKELFHLRFRNAMRQLDNPLEIRFLRRDLARMKTALSEHRLGVHRLASDESVSS